MAAKISPTRLALLMSPPTIVVEFTKGKQKRYIRRFQLKKLKPSSNAKRTVERLQKLAPNYLGGDVIDSDQLLRMVERLLRHKQEGAKENEGQNARASEEVSAKTVPEAEVADTVDGEKAGEADTNDNEDDEDDGKMNLDAVDLNKVSQFQLAMAKRQMDEDFIKNRLKPGDEGYVHDKQVEFDEEEMDSDNSWDDEE